MLGGIDVALFKKEPGAPLPVCAQYSLKRHRLEEETEAAAAGGAPAAAGMDDGNDDSNGPLFLTTLSSSSISETEETEVAESSELIMVTRSSGGGGDSDGEEQEKDGEVTIGCNDDVEEEGSSGVLFVSDPEISNARLMQPTTRAARLILRLLEAGVVVVVVVVVLVVVVSVCWLWSSCIVVTGG
jgi:hypothetical protein